MTLKEYFGDWLKVIDKVELARIVKWLSKQDSETLCPSPKDVFKAFRICPYNECKSIWIGLDRRRIKIIKYEKVNIGN